MPIRELDGLRSQKNRFVFKTSSCFPLDHHAVFKSALKRSSLSSLAQYLTHPTPAHQRRCSEDRTGLSHLTNTNTLTQTHNNTAVVHVHAIETSTQRRLPVITEHVCTRFEEVIDDMSDDSSLRNWSLLGR